MEWHPIMIPPTEVFDSVPCRGNSLGPPKQILFYVENIHLPYRYM